MEHPGRRCCTPTDSATIGRHGSFVLPTDAEIYASPEFIRFAIAHHAIVTCAALAAFLRDDLVDCRAKGWRLLGLEQATDINNVTIMTDAISEPQMPRLRNALDKVRPEMLALAKKDLYAVNLDPIAAAEIACAAVPRHG